jgi:hypothetical protein
MGLAEDYPEIYKASADQWRVELTGSGKVATFKFTNGMAASVEFEGILFNRVE